MPTGFRLNYKGAQVDLDDVYVRKYFFGSNTGYLWTWGQPTLGILGDNAIIARSSPVQTAARGFNWAQISAGSSLSCGVKTDGTLWTWGSGSVGRLGDNSIVSKSSPVQTVAGGANWRQVSSTTTQNIAAIKSDGTLWTWGSNGSGQLGDNTTINRSSPVQTIAGGTNWKQVSAGNQRCLAIKTDGTLWAWGLNNQGAIGDNSIINRSSPVQVQGKGIDWQFVSNYTQVLALKSSS